MQGHDDVAIFWDYENCHAPLSVPGYDIVNSIRSVAHTFGSVKLFKAYLELSEQSTSAKCLSHRSELQSSGVSLTDCPHNGRKNVADQMIIVDMLTYAMDKPAPTTIILISGDRDFAYAVATLRLRQYRVVIISPPVLGAHASLKAHASAYFDWNAEIMGKVDVDVPSPTVPKSGKTEAAPSLSSARAKPGSSPEAPIPPSPPATLRSSRSFLAEPRPGCSLPDQGRTKGDSNSAYESRFKETHVAQPVLPQDPGWPDAFRESVTPLDDSDRPQSRGISIGRGYGPVSGVQTTMKITPIVVSTCPETLPVPLSVPGKCPSVVVDMTASKSAPLPFQEPITAAPYENGDSCRYPDLQTGRPHSGGVLLESFPSSETADGRGPTNMNTYTEARLPAPTHIQTFSPRLHQEPIAVAGPAGRHVNQTSKEATASTISSTSVSSVSGLSMTSTSSLSTSHGPHDSGANVVKPITPSPGPSRTAVNTGSESKPLPLEFKLLVEQLEKHHKNGLLLPSRSTIAVELTKADKMVYRRAGVEKFRQYVALAENAGIVQLGMHEKEAWIRMHPAWRGRVS